LGWEGLYVLDGRKGRCEATMVTRSYPNRGRGRGSRFAGNQLA
jgi:hypothetical protein